MIDGAPTPPAPKRKHTTSTPNRPSKWRKSVRLARIRGSLENPQGSTSQPVEINDSGDEQPPQLEGEENEKEVGGNEEGETEEETEQPEQVEAETEQREESPLKNPLQEDELAKILANMGKYGQPLSPLGLQIEEEPKEHSAQDKNAPEELHDEEENEENHYVHEESMTAQENDEDIEREQSTSSQTTPEELHEEEGVDKEVTQEITEPTRVSTLEQPEKNSEGASQKENQGIGQDNSLGLSK